MPVTPRGHIRSYRVKFKNYLNNCENSRRVSGRRSIRKLRDSVKYRVKSVRFSTNFKLKKEYDCLFSEKLDIFLCSAYQSGELPKVIRSKDISRMLNNQRYKCFYCGSDINAYNFGFDHIIPRMRGGLTSIGNISLCCGTCNSRKKSKHRFEFNIWIKNLNKKYKQNIT